MKLRKVSTALVAAVCLLLSFQSLALDPVGTAPYSELGSEQYLGTLYLDSSGQSAGEVLASSQRKRMELRFLDDVSRRSWSRNWTQSMAINSPRDQMVDAADELSEVLSAFQSGLKYGDQVVIDYDPLYGTSVSVNGVDLVKEKSSTLFNLFLSTWIGPVPPNSQFKSAVLGKTDSGNDYTRFLAVTPSDERVAAVKDWSTKLKAEEEKALAEAKAEEERKLAEEEAMKKAEEEAQKQAEAEALAEQQALALIQQEKRKAQEAVRKAAEAAEAARLEAEKAAALAQGDGEAAEDEETVDFSVEAILAQQDYTTKVIRQIYSSVAYPKSAIKRNQEGSVRAIVSIDRDGSIISVKVVEESRFRTLNEAAVDAINSAAPFPSIPEVVAEQTLDMMVPIAFRLN